MKKKQHRKQSPPDASQILSSPAGATIAPQPIESEVRSSYLDYAMSVIVQRALPDVRDGLKPVHRRILYAMWSMGLRAGAKFRKSATVVGETLGKYHPHGDQAVYDSLVRMAQDFAMRTMLINGQGNFGSMDGDGAAAMRYTECKLAAPAEELLADIEKETVAFVPNYDGTHEEPRVLPARLPNLLLNGGMGIAVGMATSIPPHNLGELCNGIIHLIDHPECTIDDLLEHIPGPDFPTGGIIYDANAMKTAYATGKGSIVMRAKTEIIEKAKGGFQILVTEIPYQVNKSTLLEKIATLVKDKKIEGIQDLRDESSRAGVRIVIDLKKDAYPKKVLNRLFQFSSLQDSFHVNMLALIDGLQPRVLTLKMMLEEYVKHRRDVITRRAQYDLDRALERAHILEGLVLALEDIDRIIATIKKSKDRDDAKLNLIKRFRLSERQAIAILEMRLQQLANLERIKVEEELKEKKKLIKELRALLNDPKKVLTIIRDDLVMMREKYGDPRRTQIVARAVNKFSEEDLIPNEATIVMFTADGYLKRLAPDTFRTQGRGGKGVVGLTTKEEDIVEDLLATTTHAFLLFFTTRGRVFQLRAFEIPQMSRTAKGQSVVNFLQLGPGEKVTTILSVAELHPEQKHLLMVTRRGLVKKVDMESFSTVRRSGLIAIKLRDGDALEWVRPVTANDEVLLATQQGQAIRFKSGDIRAMGRNAAGVRGIRLKGDDDVVGMASIGRADRSSKKAYLLVVTGNGFGKRTPISAYKMQHRGGSGMKIAKVTPKTGPIVRALFFNQESFLDGMQGDLLIMSEKGQVIRLPMKSVSVLGRTTQGVRLMRFKAPADKVATVALV